MAAFLASRSPGLFVQHVWRHYAIYIALLVLISLLAALEAIVSDTLRFDRAMIDQGQVWRLLTANWTHLSFNHYLGNSLGVLLLAYIAGSSLNSREGFALFLWCMMVVGTGLYLFAPHLEYYVGLSGALHGMLLAAPFYSRLYSRYTANGFALLIVVKVIWEQSAWYNDMAMSDVIGGRVETKSHLLGAVAGIVFLLYHRWLKMKVTHDQTSQ